MSDIFFKPYLSEAENVHFCYTREKLSQRPIYPTYVLDGGGTFFIYDMFKSADSDKWLPAITDGSFFEYWSRNGKFEWDAIFKDYHTVDYPQEAEGNIWINRLYILLPLAQKYMITKDERFARKWLEIFTSWVENNPYTDYSDKPRDLVWENMQVGTRVINLVNSLFMLGECPCFTKENREFIYASLKLHGEELYRELLVHSKTVCGDNHVLQMAEGAIMFGVLLPELCDSAAFIDVARQIIRNNIVCSIYEDGCNNEDSMSYSHFIARLYLESYLLLTKNGFDSVEGLADTIQKQYAFLYNFASPSGKTLQIGDSYAMDAFRDIEFVNSVYPLKLTRERKTVVSSSSRMSVLRAGDYSVYIDAADMVEWHQHFGRPHFVAFAGELPLAVDCGGANYDRGMIFGELHSAGAHNVIYCEEIPLKRNPSNEVLENVAFTEKDGTQCLTIRNTVSGEGRGYTWERAFEVGENGIRITDRVKASGKMHFVSKLHFMDSTLSFKAYWSKLQPVNEDKTVLTLRRQSELIEVRCDSPFELSLEPCTDEKNMPNYSDVLVRKHFADEFTETTVITRKKIR